MATNVNVASAGLSNPLGYVEEVLAQVKAKNPAEPEFHQAVQEVLESLRPVLSKHPEYRAARILERLVEPERALTFRAPGFDDQGNIQNNRGLRALRNRATRPHQGGPRFPHSGNLGHRQCLLLGPVFQH